MPNPANQLQGPVRFLVGIAANATTGTPDVLPADTVVLGSAWGGGWVDCGYTTEDGVTLHDEYAWNPQRNAQDSTPSLYTPGDAIDRANCMLTEATLANIKRALGRGVLTSVAPSGPTPGHDDLTLTDPTTPSYIAVGLEHVAPPNTKGNPRRIFFPIAMATEAVELTMRRTNLVGVPITIMRVGPSATSAVVMRDITTS